MNAESWRCISTLRGHNGDVLDLAWSPHDVWLATCSVDNTIIIWDADKLPRNDLIYFLYFINFILKFLLFPFCKKYLRCRLHPITLLLVWNSLKTFKHKIDFVLNKSPGIFLRGEKKLSESRKVHP